MNHNQPLCVQVPTARRVWPGPTGPLLALLLLLACTGCNRRPELGQVTGRVLVDGVPAGPGRVIFMPDESQGNVGKGAMGEFSDDGRFTLTTWSDGDGAIVGHHRVIVQAHTTVHEDESSVGSIPLEYRNASRPLLSATVQPGKNHIEMKLDSSP